MNQKITEAEARVQKAEDRVQSMDVVLAKIIKVMSEQEAKLLDQESISRRLETIQCQ